MTTVGDEISDIPGSVREVTLDHPWRWISAGWSDLKRAPGVSFFFGSMFVAVSYLLVIWSYSSDRFFLVPPLVAGFFLIAPLLAMGLYDVSRRLELDLTPDILQTCGAWRANPFNLLVMGLILLLLMLCWMMTANLVFAIFYSGITPKLDNLVNVLFLSGNSPVFLFMGMFTGSLFAMAVFCISVVSVPMLLERQVDALTAIETSVAAVKKNPRPLALWASLIVMFTGIGLVTFFFGLVVIMPLIGYATWHAYRDLVVES